MHGVRGGSFLDATSLSSSERKENNMFPNGYPYPPIIVSPPQNTNTNTDPIAQLKAYTEFLEYMQAKNKKEEPEKNDVKKSRYSTVQWIILLCAAAPFVVLAYDLLLIMMLKNFINIVQTLVK